MQQILIIEDDRALNQGLCKALKTDNSSIQVSSGLYASATDRQIVSCENLKDAKEQLLCGMPALILLDINLPDGSGLDFLQSVKRECPDCPVILLTANDTDGDIVNGLELGADDYITKPFSPKELVLRVNNIIKRAYRDDNNRISIDGYELDEEQRKIYADNVEIELTTKEFDLLMMFIKNKGIAFSRDKILENVWDENYFVSDRVVDDTLRRLRKKLPNLNIHTIYGYGYRLG